MRRFLSASFVALVAVVGLHVPWSSATSTDAPTPSQGQITATGNHDRGTDGKGTDWS